MQRRSLFLITLVTALASAAGPALAQSPDWKKVRIGVEGAYPRSGSRPRRQAQGL
jgi:arginine/ornithine transport system substrate-binding protein